MKAFQEPKQVDRRHAKWVEFLQAFPYVIKYKKGNANDVVNTLSRRYVLITMMTSKPLGFKLINERYPDDPQFALIYVKGAINGVYKHEEYLFKSRRLCIPNGSIRELLVREAHSRGLAAHSGEKKTFEMVKRHFY